MHAPWQYSRRAPPLLFCRHVLIIPGFPCPHHPQCPPPANYFLGGMSHGLLLSPLLFPVGPSFVHACVLHAKRHLLQRPLLSAQLLHSCLPRSPFRTDCFLHPFQRHCFEFSAASDLFPPPNPCQCQSLICPVLDCLCLRNTKLALGFGLLSSCSESFRILHLLPPCHNLVKLAGVLLLCSINLMPPSESLLVMHVLPS